MKMNASSLRTLLHIARTERLVTVGIIISLLLIGYITLIPKRFLGDAFFGGVPALYNIELADFFMHQSLRFDAAEDGKPIRYTHYQIGRIKFIEGDLIGALSSLYRELEVYPDSDRAYYMLGLTYGYLGEEERAIEAFKKFNELNPTSWAGHNDLAWLQFRLGDIDAAIETTITALNANPPNPWTLNTLGVLLINKGDYEGARLALNEAHTLTNYMTKEFWGEAYPGNDPRIYDEGLTAMKIQIQKNLDLLAQKEARVDSEESDQ